MSPKFLGKLRQDGREGSAVETGRDFPTAPTASCYGQTPVTWRCEVAPGLAEAAAPACAGRPGSRGAQPARAGPQPCRVKAY